MKEILLYTDDGAGSLSIKQTYQALIAEQIHKTYSVRKILRDHLIDQAWEKSTALIIMPGGRDIPYHNALKGSGNKRIRKYVEEGGKYLGICAGAYYGCAQILFEKGHPLEVTGTRELAFFPGTAEGPAYGPGTFSYSSDRGARIAQLQEPLSGRSSSAYFNGGCLFQNAQNTPLTTILSTYQDISTHPAAIIACEVGKGLAVLSGVHPEYSTTLLPLQGFNCLEIEEMERSRKQLFRNMLETLGLHI